MSARQSRHVQQKRFRLQCLPCDTHQTIGLSKQPEVFSRIHKKIFQRLPYSPFSKQTVRMLQHLSSPAVYHHQNLLVFHPYPSCCIGIRMMKTGIIQKAADMTGIVVQIIEARPVVQVKLPRRSNHHTSILQLGNVPHLIARQTLSSINRRKHHKRAFGKSLSCHQPHTCE